MYADWKMSVVYHLISSSNHNWDAQTVYHYELYIILFHHQTTTVSLTPSGSALLYIILFHHQTTTSGYKTLLEAELYIILFHHQTTTNNHLRGWL